MKSLDPRVLTMMLHDVECLLSVNLSRDIQRIVERTNHEGESFLSMTLPTLDDLLLAGLSNGTLPVLPGWKYKDGVPLFLSPLWKRIFGASGHLLDAPDKDSILAIRQISRTFKKVYEVCSDDRVADAINGFVDVDRSMSNRVTIDVSLYRRVSRWLFPWINDQTVFDDLTPVHGSGATADRKIGPAKYDLSVVPRGAFEHISPLFYTRTWSNLLEDPPIEADQLGRLVAVPKTATKPRLISIEPSSMQYSQQAVHTVLKRELSRTWFSNYSEQAPNQELARIGSITGGYATIDLSDASDRIPHRLVSEIFRGTVLGPLLETFRTKGIETPDGRIVPLKKYASMGSALTFPVQIMVFSIICVVGILGQNPSYDGVRDLVKRRRFRVYGDDIIVPTDSAERTMGELEEAGLKVNTNKSFFTGSFRESCGADWYDGFPVTPVYLRKRMCVDRGSASVVSFVSFRNQLWQTHRYHGTVKWLDKQLDHLNLSTHDCFRHHVEGTLCGWADTRVKWNPELFREEFRALATDEIRDKVEASTEALIRFSLSRIGSEETSYDPLAEYSRPNRLRSSVRRRPKGLAH